LARHFIHATLLGSGILPLHPGDGAFTVEIIATFDGSAVLAKFRAALKTKSNQPHAPQPTAVLLSGNRFAPRFPDLGFTCGPGTTRFRGYSRPNKTGKGAPPIYGYSINLILRPGPAW